MVVVHYKTEDLRPRLEAFVLTHDSGASDVDFLLGCMDAASTLTRNLEDITTLYGHLSPFP